LYLVLRVAVLYFFSVFARPFPSDTIRFSDFLCEQNRMSAEAITKHNTEIFQSLCYHLSK